MELFAYEVVDLICVGIFFLVNDSIIADKGSYEDATKSEFFVEHGEHYNFWLNLIPSTKSEFAFKSHAYDYYPRGRVVLDIQSNKIRLFIDRCIGTSSMHEIVDMFGLSSEQIHIRYDEHYQCHSCNNQFLDDLDNPIEDFEE